MGKTIKGYRTYHDDRELQTRLDLASAVAKLAPRQQAIVALRCLGYTQQAITQLLGVSRTTVWADEKDALAKIAYYYDPEAIEEGRE